jgi:FkbM family methyltransferase
MTITDLNNDAFRALPEPHEVAFLLKHFQETGTRSGRIIDVGAHYGGFSSVFLDSGFQVEAFEPCKGTNLNLRSRLRQHLESGDLRVHDFAASNKDGFANLFVSGNSGGDTLNSLNPEWKTIAFPEFFQNTLSERVRTARIGPYLRGLNVEDVLLVKIDTEGHEAEALAGLMHAGPCSMFPPIVMFEVNKRFPAECQRCLSYLAEAGYETYVWWIKADNERVLHHETRYDASNSPILLPFSEYFYGNVVCFHQSYSNRPKRVGVIDSRVRTGGELNDQWSQMQTSLKTALSVELRHNETTNLCHPSWQQFRAQVQAYLLGPEMPMPLSHPIVVGTMVRGGRTESQHYEETYLRHCVGDSTRLLIESYMDVEYSNLQKECLEGRCSTNTLGHLYYAARLHDALDQRGMSPSHIVEFGGGYGNLARILLHVWPKAQITIIDFPEFLALQQHFLSSTVPDCCYQWQLSSAAVSRSSGSITFVPHYIPLKQIPAADIFVSTFALSEASSEMQSAVVRRGFFDAQLLYLTGQLKGADPVHQWADHSYLHREARNHFPITAVTPFHVFQYGITLYELIAERTNAGVRI